MMDIKRARKLLGEKAEQMSDNEVQEIISQLETLAHICIDSFLAEKRKELNPPKS